MPTADAGNLSGLVVRCSRDLHRLLNRLKHSVFYCSRVTKRALEKVRNLAGIGSGTGPVASTI
jgi:hypothetical protein